MSEIDWANAPHLPRYFEPRQQLFYKLSYDRKRLYVYDDGQWKISGHEVQNFFKWESPIENPNFSAEMDAIKQATILPLRLWCALGSGRGKALAKFIGVSHSFITNVLNGRKELPINLVLMTSDFTGIHPEYLRPDIAVIFGIHVSQAVKNESK